VRPRHALAMALGVLACAPATASAQTATAVDTFFGPSLEGAHIVRTTEARVTSTGGLSVAFSSDPATCAAAGRCGLEGTIAWRPGKGGTLYTLDFARGRRRTTVAQLLLGTPLNDLGALHVVARVHRSTEAGQGECVDGTTGLAFLVLPVTRGAMTIGLRPHQGLGLELATRCAAPLLDDILAALPERRVAASAMRRGRQDVDLRAERAFTAGGLQGTVRSDLVVHIGVPKEERLPKEAAPRGRRVRMLTSEFAIERVSGRLALDVRGEPDPAACGVLDSCGLAGSAVLAPRATRGEAYLTALASARRGRRVLRAAVGLAPGGARAVETYGTGSWTDRGTIEATIGRTGEPPCTDRGTLGQAALLLTTSGTRVDVVYAPGFGDGAALRTRCPGPVLGTPLATASVPLRAFARRRVTLRLRRALPAGSDGYTVTARPDLTIVLRREKVTEQLVRNTFIGDD